MARRRFTIFVITIFIIACILAAGYLLFGHPGQTDGQAKVPSTSEIQPSIQNQGAPRAIA